MNIFTVVWVSWFLSEVLLNRLFRSKIRKEDSPDNHSLRILWGTIIIALTAGITIANLVSAPLCGLSPSAPSAGFSLWTWPLTRSTAW
ncbi:MAG: hypothetical protein P8100_03895 [bacterium]